MTPNFWRLLARGVGNRDAISLLGRLSSGLLSILIASRFPSAFHILNARTSSRLPPVAFWLTIRGVATRVPKRGL